MSAALYQLHADRPPVAQERRYGPLPKATTSLARVRSEMRKRAHLEDRRIALCDLIEACTVARARVMAQALKSDRELAEEQRASARRQADGLEEDEAKARERLAEIDAKLAASGQRGVRR
jgi:predicted nucleic acid-binding protein